MTKDIQHQYDKNIYNLNKMVTKKSRRYIVIRSDDHPVEPYKNDGFRSYL
jgi:hypothetical protein